jgi:hypothetical protein
VANDSEWWKNYYVRYFVGTAFAIPLVLILSKNLAWIGDIGDLSQRPWISAVVVGFGGLAFCYAASAPILVFHSVRSAIWRRPKIFKYVVFSISAASACALAAAFLVRFVQIPALSWVFAIPFAALMVLQVACLFVLATRLDGAQKFYSHIARNRAETAESQSIRSEYVESYRHLREHGNAFSILSMEIVLTLALLNIGNSKEAFALILIAWILPSTIAWVIGTWLEGSIEMAI